LITRPKLGLGRIRGALKVGIVELDFWLKRHSSRRIAQDFLVASTWTYSVDDQSF
jgi:hypothetical protein